MNSKKSNSRKILALVLSFGMIFQQLGFAQIATELNVAGYFGKSGVGSVQDKFRPLELRYFSYNSANDNFKLLLDKGDQKQLDNLKAQEEAKVLLNYFLIGVALPNEAFWVNLRPDSQDQIIDQYLEKTDIGKIMLAADVQLKKDTANFTSPETAIGREYWKRLYKKAAEIYGNQNVTIPTLTRPWIVPGEVIIRESQGSAYVYKATLKVMLEQDYLKNSATYNFPDARSKALNEYSSQLIREMVIPNLTKEVNSSKRYASLRQVFHSLVLARWFKLRFTGKAGTYAALINTKNLTNLTSQTAWSKTTYFKQYQESFTKGEYSVKEPVTTPTGQVIRSYFSGGITGFMETSAATGMYGNAATVSAIPALEGTVFEGDGKGLTKLTTVTTHEESRKKTIESLTKNAGGLTEAEVDAANALKIDGQDIKAEDVEPATVDVLMNVLSGLNKNERVKLMDQAVDVITNGQSAVHFLFAGSATRLGLGPMYFVKILDLFKIISDEFAPDPSGIRAKVKEYVAESGRNYNEFVDSVRQAAMGLTPYANLGMGPIQLIAYRAALLQFAKEHKIDAQALIKRTPIIIHANDESFQSITEDLIAKKFYGFNPENVLLLNQAVYKGYKVNEDGEFVIDENSAALPSGHGDTLEQFKRTEQVYVFKNGSFTKIQPTLLETLKSKGVRFIHTQRINDLAMWTPDVLSVERLAYFMHKVNTENAQMGIELVGNPGKQKGGSFIRRKGTKRGFLVETLALKTNKLKSIAEMAGEQGLPYNRFANFYTVDGLDAILSKHELPRYLSVKGKDKNLFYVDTVTGDATQLPDANAVAFTYDKDALIHDFKEFKNIVEALKFLRIWQESSAYQMENSDYSEKEKVEIRIDTDDPMALRDGLEWLRDTPRNPDAPDTYFGKGYVPGHTVGDIPESSLQKPSDREPEPDPMAGISEEDIERFMRSEPKEYWEQGLLKPGDRKAPEKTPGRPTVPGKSPEDMFDLIMLSKLIQDKIKSQGYFLLEDALNAYRAEYRDLNFQRLAGKSPDSTARRDLERLVRENYLKKTNSNEGYRYSLTETGYLFKPSSRGVYVNAWQGYVKSDVREMDSDLLNDSLEFNSFYQAHILAEIDKLLKGKLKLAKNYQINAENREQLFADLIKQRERLELAVTQDKKQSEALKEPNETITALKFFFADLNTLKQENIWIVNILELKAKAGPIEYTIKPKYIPTRNQFFKQLIAKKDSLRTKISVDDLVLIERKIGTIKVMFKDYWEKEIYWSQISKEKRRTADAWRKGELFDYIHEYYADDFGIEDTIDQALKDLASMLKKLSKTPVDTTSQNTKDVGGIDFNIRLMTIQRTGSMSGLTFNLPRLTPQALAQFNIGAELANLKSMVKAGIEPSGERLKGVVAACVQKGELSNQANSLLICLVDVLKMQEESATDASTDLKEALVIVDSIS